MSENFLDYRQLQSEQAAENFRDILIANSYENNVYAKQKAKINFDHMFEHLKDKKSSPASKFFIFWIIKEFIQGNEIKFISLLSSHPLFAQMQEYAYIDMKKSANEKGRKLFAKDENGYGNSIVRINLEGLVSLGQTFPYKNEKKQPTKFKKVLTRIEQQKVVLPEEFIFYGKKKKKGAVKKQSIKNDPVKTKPKESHQMESNTVSNKQVKIDRLIDFTKLKLEEFVGNLQELQQDDQKRQEILKKHELLKKQDTIYNNYSEQIFECSEKIVNEYIDIKQIIQRQNQLFQKHIPSNNFQAYTKSFKEIYYKTYPQTTSTPKPRPSQIKKSVVKKQEMQAPKEPGKKEEVKVEKVSISQTSQKMVKRQSLKKREQVMDKAPLIVTDLIATLNSKSRAKVNGFKMIQESLQKQKKLIQVHPPRNKENKGVKGSKLQMSSFVKSTFKAATIFTHPPNPNPPYKHYDGDVIKQSRELKSILYEIKKDQGSRRFKISNLRDRHPLYENDHLQIGFKTQPIYEEVEKFDSIISIQLFFGNKTTKKIKHLQVFFEGDSKTLVYSNPQTINANIEAQCQVKHQIMVLPKKIPFGFINMKFSYQVNGNSIHSSAALPNSILKFSDILPMNKVEFQSFWDNNTHSYKTEHFKLSRYVPPSALKKYMQALTEGTKYSQFSEPGSKKDYQLFCSLELRKMYDCMLKINIRPDLNVVLQICSIDPSEDHLSSMKFYLQSLQLVLEQCG